MQDMPFDVVSAVFMMAAVFLSSILRAFTGFGFALAAIPVLALFLPPSTTVVVVASLTLLVSLQTVKEFWDPVEVKRSAGMIGASILGTAAGAVFLGMLSVSLFQLIVGVTVIAASLMLNFAHPKEREVGSGLKAVIGFLSGIMNGLLAIPGPPVIIYALSAYATPARSRGFLMIFFLFSAAFALTGFGVQGFIGITELMYIAAAYPAMYAGNRFGNKWFQTHGSATYRRIANATLLLIGISAVAKALAG